MSLTVESQPYRPTKHDLMELFSQSYQPYCFGAFGKPTTREIDSAIKTSRFVCFQSANGKLSAAALFTMRRSRSYQIDFAGRTWLVPSGSLYIRHLGVLPSRLPESVASLMEQLKDRTQNLAICVEIFEENRLLREVIEAIGFRYVMTKIMASSDIRRLYVKGVTELQLSHLSPADVPSLVCLAPNFISRDEQKEVIRELNDYLEKRGTWQQHYSHYNRRHSWTAFTLRGYDSDPAFIIRPAEMSKRWRAEHPETLQAACRNTKAAKHFPITVDILKRIPGVKERIRFMRLAANRGELSRHSDITNKEAGTQDNCLMRLHLPLMTHEEVLVESWDARGNMQQMHFATGGLYYLDQRKPHRVVNHSPSDRVHLVVDSYSSPELRKLGRGLDH